MTSVRFAITYVIMGWAEGEWGDIEIPEIPGRVKVKARDVDGRLCVVGLRIELDPPATLTHSVMQRLPIGQIEAIINHYGDQMREAHDRDFRLPGQPSGWRLTDDFLKDVARAFAPPCCAARTPTRASRPM